MVTRVRPTTVWQLIDAVGKLKLGPVLALLAEVYDPRDRGLPLLAILGSSVRQLAKFDAARRSGANEQEAAQRAGVPPFRIGPVAALSGAVPRGTFVRWLRLLAETDLALKGSRRAPQAVLEKLVIDMMRR